MTRSGPFNVAHAATCICHVEFCVAVCFSFSLTINGRKFGSVSQSVSLLQTISKLCLKQKLVHKCFLTQSQRIPNGVYNYTFTSLWPLWGTWFFCEHIGKEEKKDRHHWLARSCHRLWVLWINVNHGVGLFTCLDQMHVQRLHASTTYTHIHPYNIFIYIPWIRLDGLM